MPTTPEPHDRVYIEDLARRLDPERAVHTIRRWINDELLPSGLYPSREGGRGRIYWLEHQVVGLQDFARAREARRGWGHLHQSSTSGESA